MTSDLSICVTNSGYYMRCEATISEIVRNVREGHYCTILGPPYCQKSHLLDDVRAQLEIMGDAVCVLLDPQDIDFAADEDFLSAFAATLGARLEMQTSVALPSLPDQVPDERSLQQFLQNCVALLNQDLILLIDHLERFRIGPLKALLRVLRAIYNERDADSPSRLVVITANSLSVAALALGSTSPFNIARVTLVQDLAPAESKKLIDYILGQKGIEITQEGRQRCIQATGGDRYLIPRLCGYCVELVSKKYGGQITEQEVEQAIQWFVDKEAPQHLPLRETIRAVEEDVIALMNVLRILERGKVPRRDLKLDLEVEIDDLQLTGAVRAETIGGQQAYQVRNEIYARYLKQHFHPDRVAHVLSVAGQWGEAIPYLGHLVTDNPQYRSSLLGTVVNAIYAARSVFEACEHLARSLSLAFNIPRARIYLVNPERSRLVLFSQVGFEEKVTQKFSLKEKNQLEVKVYFGEDYIVSDSAAGEQVLLIRLVRENEDPLGLAAVHSFEADPRREDFLELLAFMKPMGKAIGSVIDREHKMVQLTTLHKLGEQVTSSLDLKQVLQTTVEAAIKAVPAAQKGSLFLWDEARQKLVIRAHKDFRPDIVDVMQLDAGEGYAGWVYTNREPLLLGKVFEDPRTVYINHPDVKVEKSAICVLLEAWGRGIGVLCLDNVTAYDAFQESDLELLSTFGAQAAIAIQNARLYTELYNLGMDINRGELSPEQIFKKVVQSITRVSDAKAANMLLLRDTDDPELSVSQRPLLSVSDGLGADYDEEIRPREDGLTVRTLKTRKPCTVSRPDVPPGINPLALEQGTQAYLCLPMMSQEFIIGVLFVHHDKLHIFSENEIEILSLFANQAAFAIESARQREELAMTKAVAWMGIVFSSLAHRITQKAGAIRNTIWGLRRLLEQQPAVIERLDRIDEYAQTVGEIPGQALLPSQDQAEPLDLNAVLRREIPRWCRSEDGIVLDFSRLTDKNTTVRADPNWLAVVLELLATNAVQAMRNSTHKELTILSQIRGQRVAAQITNTGEEIPEEVRNRLFKESIPRDQGVGGSGVGLLIARTIMRRYGGDIELLRTGTEETTFLLWLPQYRPSNG